MEQRLEDIAVHCYVPTRLFNLAERGSLRVLVVGTLVHEQDPFENEHGHTDDGWPSHFHSLNVYQELGKRTYVLPIASDRAYETCEHAALAALRDQGFLSDEDEEILDQYG